MMGDEHDEWMRCLRDRVRTETATSEDARRLLEKVDLLMEMRRGDAIELQRLAKAHERRGDRIAALELIVDALRAGKGDPDAEHTKNKDRLHHRPPRPELAALLKKAREARGLQQIDLAISVGLVPTMISDVERGKTDLSTGRLAQFADVLKIDFEDVLEAAGRCVACHGTGVADFAAIEAKRAKPTGRRSHATRQRKNPAVSPNLRRVMMKLRAERGISQRELSEKLGLHPSRISQVEAPTQDARKTIGNDLLVRIAKALDVNAAVLMEAAGRCLVCQGTSYDPKKPRG